MSDCFSRVFYPFGKMGAGVAEEVRRKNRWWKKGRKGKIVDDQQRES